MKRDQTDIVICGGGVAGLAAACSLGAAGFQVLCVEPSAPVTHGNDAASDLRTTAFLQPARQVLEDAGIWPRLAPTAMPLQTMRIVDATADAPVSRDFDASDISEQPFGWNLRNWLLRREMMGRIAELPNVTFRTGVGFKSMLARDAANIVTFTDKTQVEARLVIGADGRNSAVRQAAGIGVSTTRYGQKALTFAVTHSAPHDSISTEVHRQGGPFTLVPLPDHEGQPCSAVVWMADGAEAQRLFDLAEPEFNAAATERSAELYGPLALATHRQIWPIISQLADRMDGPRVALMAEAAHVMPPIGAQGLNMSLRDLACLRDLAIAQPGDLGSAKMLATYNRERHRDAQLRVAGINLLNRTSQTGLPMLQSLRRSGIKLLHDTTPVRRGVMRLGLGAG